jgi:hypothetical protein
MKVTKSNHGGEQGSYGGDEASAKWKERSPLAEWERLARSWIERRGKFSDPGEINRSQSKK